LEKRRVVVAQKNGKRELEFEFPVIATGSRSQGDTPFKGLGSMEAPKEKLHEYQARVKKAKTIVVGGARVIGVEVSGEIAFEYGREKDVILVS